MSAVAGSNADKCAVAENPSCFFLCGVGALLREPRLNICTPLRCLVRTFGQKSSVSRLLLNFKFIMSGGARLSDLF